MTTSSNVATSLLPSLAPKNVADLKTHADNSDCSSDEVFEIKTSPSNKNVNEKRKKSLRIRNSLKNIDELTVDTTTKNNNTKNENEAENLLKSAYKKSSSKRFSIDENKNNMHHLSTQDDYQLGQCDVYIELEVLNYDERGFVNSSNDIHNYEWRIKTRWIKYEQTFDELTSQWSKPFVGSLIYQNLILLKSKMQYASIIFNSKESTFERIVEGKLFCDWNS